jgi:hypothetical protein
MFTFTSRQRKLTGARKLMTAARELNCFADKTARSPTVHAQKPRTPGAPAVDRGKSKDQYQAEEEAKCDSASKPGGFDNDPDDPTNPNEVRERHLKKIHP